jgi:hypothetical protein
MHATACYRRLVTLLGGVEARALEGYVEAWFAKNEVTRPEKLTRMWTPGFAD